MILQPWRADRFTLVVSDYIEQELRRTLAGPYFSERIPSEDQEVFLILLADVAKRVAIRRRVSGAATHLEDDPILATALSARADYLVTGDQRLLSRVPSFRGIPLLSPAEFLDVLSQES